MSNIPAELKSYPATNGCAPKPTAPSPWASPSTRKNCSATYVLFQLLPWARCWLPTSKRVWWNR